MKTLLMCTLAVVMLTGAAFAQSNSLNPLASPENPGMVSDGTAGKKRQPTQRSLSAAEGTVGTTIAPVGETALDKENRRLDNAIKNICRGC